MPRASAVLRRVRRRHAQGCLGRTPIEPEVLTQIKDEILDLNDFPTLECDDTDTTVLADSACPVGKIDVPVSGHDIGTCHGEYVLGTNLLDVKVDLGILLEELPAPVSDSNFPSESTTGPHFARVDQHTIVTPSGHEAIEVVVTQGSKGVVDSLPGDNCSDHISLR